MEVENTKNLENLVQIISSDNTHVSVNRDAIKLCITVKNMMEDLGEETSEFCLDVSTTELQKIVEFCTYHHEIPPSPLEEENKRTPNIDQEWDRQFVGAMSPEENIKLTLVANFLDNQHVIQLCAKSFASLVSGKTPEQIRATFNIKNDLTPEEEEQIAKESGLFDEIVQ